MNNNDELLFSADDDIEEIPINSNDGGWKILIVDDEPEIHQITKLTLVNFSFEDRNLEFLHAYNADEASTILNDHSDIALILLDVVMETDHAGLNLVKIIREQMNNHCTRIVLRTGQPGIAPERDVIINYDINDYAEKSELSAQKLFTIVVASLRSYRDIIALEFSKNNLTASNQQLSKERQRIQVTLNSIGDAVLTTDANGNITHLNPVAENLTGWEIQDAIGKPLTKVFNIVNATTRKTVKNPVEKVLRTGKIVGLANHTILISKNGTEFQIADSAAPIQDKDSETLGVVLVCRDVTQEYLTEEALRRSQKMDAVGQLSGGIAHDYNNILGVILGYSDLLNSIITKQPILSDYLEKIIHACDRGEKLTKRLLSFSRKKSSYFDKVDINDLLLAEKNMLERTLTSRITVDLTLHKNPYSIYVDDSELEDAILNISINAMHAISETGTLKIVTDNKCINTSEAEKLDLKSGDYMLLTITDSGCGMSQETKDNIFNPFFTTKGDKGTGLGLSQVYGFINRCGGAIAVESILNQGTSFTLYFPKYTGPATEASKVELIEEESNIHENETARILVVDDEKALLNLSYEILTKYNYEVLRAENAEQALEIIKNNHIDLLISDIIMPEMNGYELASIVKEKYPKIKILLASGFADDDYLDKTDDNLSKNILKKPYNIKSLLQKTRAMLQKAT